jgi:cyclic lactone autoinducer peptide
MKRAILKLMAPVVRSVANYTANSSAPKFPSIFHQPQVPSGLLKK